MKKRKRYTGQFKFRVALEAAKGEKTRSEIARQYEVHPAQVTKWKRELMEGEQEIFASTKAKAAEEATERAAELYEQIGRLKMALEWLKKKLPSSIEEKRKLIEPGQAGLSIRRQCELVGLARSTLYYEAAQETPFNLMLMARIDRQYLKTPFYGYRKMTEQMRRDGYAINHKRIERLMQVMGLAAIYPEPRTTKSAAAHKKYPYLLRGLSIERPNQVWCADTLAPYAVQVSRIFRCRLASCTWSL